MSLSSWNLPQTYGNNNAQHVSAVDSQGLAVFAFSMFCVSVALAEDVVALAATDFCVMLNFIVMLLFNKHKRRLDAYSR